MANMTEDQIQQAVIRWSQQASVRKMFPQLALLYHIPNERKCTPQQGARLKRMGVKSGVPDIFLPVGVQKIDSVDRGQYTIIRTKYNGPYIELKRLRGGTVSAAQKQWIARLRDAGYAVEVCKGWEAAAAVITNYLEGRYKPQFQCE